MSNVDFVIYTCKELNHKQTNKFIVNSRKSDSCNLKDFRNNYFSRLFLAKLYQQFDSQIIPCNHNVIKVSVHGIVGFLCFIFGTDSVEQTKTK